MRRFLLPALVFLGSLVFADYPVFERDFISADEHKARRDSLKAKLAPGEIAIFFASPERIRNDDVDFQYRQDSNFLYLTGFNEPDAALLLAPSGMDIGGKTVTEVLFCNESTPQSETWLGYRMQPAGAKALLKFEQALPNTKMEEVLGQLKPSAVAKPNFPTAPIRQLAKMDQAVRNWIKDRPVAKLDATAELARMRVVKSPDELRLLKRAINASVEGHTEVLRSAELGMSEYDLGAVFHYVIGRRGCEYVGYPNIIGAGENSCILHYNANRKKIQANEIICLDAGGEYHGYTADVTRSFPISGTFNAEQRAIYNLVLEAQRAGIEACQVGKPFSGTDAAARKVIAAGLVKLGIVAKESEANRYFMHGTSHHLGLDVHDPSGSATLMENMVLTVEPGIYIKAGSPCDKKWWNIGVRIEDDILVTKSGPVNLSAGVPREISDIEKLMKETGIGNRPFGLPSLDH